MEGGHRLHRELVRKADAQLGLHRPRFGTAAGMAVIGAAMATALILSPLNFAMGGPDRLDKKPAAVKVEKESHADKITASKLNQVKQPKTAARIPVEGIFAEKQGFWGKVGDFFGPSKAYGADGVIPASDVFEVRKETAELGKRGVVQEVKLDGYPGQTIKIREWILDVTRAPQGNGKLTPNGISGSGFSAAFVYNNKSKKDDRAPFVTMSLQPMALELGVVDHSLVKGYVIQRPDDPKQSILVLACKDHLDIYVLNDKGGIEWVPIILKDVGIEKKPELLIGLGQNKIGKFIEIIIFDEKVTKGEISGNIIDLMLVRVYTKPENPPISDFDGYGTALAKMDLRK